MIVQTGNFTVSGRDFAVQVTSGTYEAPLHLHQHAQVVYAEEGTLEISDGQRAETLTAGSFAYILPFQVHALRTPASAHFRLWVFSDHYLHDFLGSRSLLRGERSVFTPDPVTREYVLSHLSDAVTGSAEGNLRVKAALFALTECYFSLVPVSVRNAESDVLSRLILYVYEHFTLDVSLSAAAQALGYHPNYLSHCFKEAMHMNFRTFVNCLRVEKAKALLSDTREPVAAIAQKSGFSSSRHLDRAFFSITGTTPLRYRSASEGVKLQAKIDKS